MTRWLSPRRVPALAMAALLVPLAASGRQRSGSTIDDGKIFEALGLRGGMTVCEIGAGDGEQTLAAARIVGPDGHVYSSELGEEHLETLRSNVQSSGQSQVTVVAGDPDGTNFPDAACDAVFMRNVYHHFADPAAMNASIAASLKPGGRVAVVDFVPNGKEAARAADRDEGDSHGVSAASVSRELAAAGFEPVSSDSGNGHWFMIVVSKP